MPDFKDTIDALAAHQRMRRHLLQQLTDLSPEQLQQLKTVWSTLPDPERINLLAYLRRQAEEDSLMDFDAVYEMAMEDPNSDVRRMAISAAVDAEDVSLMDRLLEVVASDPDVMVRAAAAERLGPFACDAEVGKLPEEDGKRLETALLDKVKSETEDIRVRAAALASAGYFSTDEVSAEIQRALTRSGLKTAALRAIGRNINPEEWTETLKESMGSDNPDVRREAAAAAADYEDTVGDLGDLVDDPDRSVRLAAIASLGQIGGPEARDFLVYCYESEDPEIRKAAAAAMDEIDSAESPLERFGPYDDTEEL
ncbi:MAG TPA: HEAT repeat domain-containing protein [Chloroflexota bacterium]|nr:HEAT repeat domain-containing protein [Chloroflexota bacterium]